MNLGLSKEEQELLTHFTRAAAEALASLRDAWLNADDDNAQAIARAIAVLMLQCRSVRRNTSMMRKVLAAGHDRHGELFDAISVCMMDHGRVPSHLSRSHLSRDRRGRGGSVRCTGDVMKKKKRLPKMPKAMLSQLSQLSMLLLQQPAFQRVLRKKRKRKKKRRRG